MSALLQVHELTKHFGGIRAVENVSFHLHAGEILALVGDNGAGKSTLAKMLAGYYHPDRGAIRLEGIPVHFETPQDARNAGIEMIYQDLSLAENLSATANVFLGRETAKPPRLSLLSRLDNQAMEAASQRTFDEQLAIQIPSVRETVRNLSGGQRQAVAIARALYWRARILIMDEPTAALGVRETRHVLELVRRLKSTGVAIMVISHSLRDIMSISDRIMVMRRGQKSGEETTATTTEDRVVKLIMGGSEASA